MQEYLKMKRFFYEAFGIEECQTAAMEQALWAWFRLYYGKNLLALPYTIGRKMDRAVFAEYQVSGPELPELRPALEQAMVGGECYLKPCREAEDFRWVRIPRNRILIFARDEGGHPTDVGFMAQSKEGKDRFTLLERRIRDGEGHLLICNRLFRSRNMTELGREIPLDTKYPELLPRFTYEGIPGVGLVELKMPMVNCIDGSPDGVSVYAAAAELIRAAEENEAQLRREFQNGASRLVVSRDLLREGQLRDDLFVALDEAPETVGITVFSPALRQESYLQRQQSYLRAIENVVGLKRGLLSQVEAVDRTATEITSSEGEYMTTILELRRVAEEGLQQAARLTAALEGREPEEISVHWGDNVV